jgi:hypothetical protein
MASRLRLFIKKRGSRRTGARWPGLLAEGALFTGLLAIGAYGLYWLIARVLVRGSETSAWWPWLAIVIPLALIGYGATNLILLMWQTATSTERRAAAVQKATNWEIPGAQSKSVRPSLPTVPPIDAVTDSPGVRLAYRLPIDAASGWVSFTMAAVCLIWNSLVAVFVAQVVRQYLNGEPNWLLIWLMLPFVLAGLWTLFALGRQVLFNLAMGTTCVEVSDHPLFPGHTYRGFVSQTGRLQVRWYQMQLVCEEQAVYQQGTDTRRDVRRVYRATAFSQRKFEITPQQAFQNEFGFTVPQSAMHSFESPHNAVIWSIVARGRMVTWGDFERRFPVYVYPVSDVQPVVLKSLSAVAGSRSP